MRMDPERWAPGGDPERWAPGGDPERWAPGGDPERWAPGGNPEQRVRTRLDLRPADLHVVAEEVAPRVVAPAADAVTDEQRRRLVAEEPLSLAGVFGPEGRDGADAGTVAGDRVRELLAAGGFRHVGPVLGFHELSRGERRQLGLVVEVPVSGWRDGTVLPHEATRSHHERTLADFVDAAGMDISPVALTYRAHSELDELAARATAGRPDLEFVGWGELRHRVWLVRDDAEIEQLLQACGALDQLTIVDGHHRVAAAARRAQRHGGAATTFLAALMPDRDLEFASYDRCVELPPDLTAEAFLTRLGEIGPVKATGGPPERPTTRLEARLYLDGAWYTLRFADAPEEVPEGLGVVQLQERVLRPLLGIEDPRTDDRLVTVPGTEPLAALAQRCSAGRAAFALAPVSLDELQQVASCGALLPPKSTYSSPKAGPGVFLRLRPRLPPAPDAGGSSRE